MKDLIKEISSYNIFNNLLPGVIYLFYLQVTKIVALNSYNIFILFFVAYFAGVVISRIGALLIEPILRALKLVKYQPYEDFIRAEKVSIKLHALQEKHAMFRAFISLIVVSGLTRLCDAFDWFKMSGNIGEIALVVFLLIIFVIAYRKQTFFIAQRVKKENENIKR